MTTYGIIKDVITRKNYELTDILAKIEKRCFEKSITEEERDELQALARENADVTKSIDVIAKLQELEMEIRVLKEQKVTDKPTEEVEEYPPFVIGKWYYNGDKCSENGKNYICTVPVGHVCNWSPSQYPAYWNEVE